MSKSYSEKLKDPRWQKKRLEIFERDKWCCKDCGSSEKTLTIHHHQYFGEPWESPDWYMSTLCEECHEMRQKLEKKVKRQLLCCFQSMNIAQMHTVLSVFVTIAGLQILERKYTLIAEECNHEAA